METVGRGREEDVGFGMTAEVDEPARVAGVAVVAGRSAEVGHVARRAAFDPGADFVFFESRIAFDDGLDIGAVEIVTRRIEPAAGMRGDVDLRRILALGTAGEGDDQE